MGRSFVYDSLTPHSFGLCRAQCYHQREAPPGEELPLAIGGHRDLGTTTLLLSDAPGLQFQPRGSDEWVDVRAPENAIVVNLGEFFEIWTKGAWRATPHRVKAACERDRVSLAFFSNQAIHQPAGGLRAVSRTIVPLDTPSSTHLHDGAVAVSDLWT